MAPAHSVTWSSDRRARWEITTGAIDPEGAKDGWNPPSLVRWQNCGSTSCDAEHLPLMLLVRGTKSGPKSWARRPSKKELLRPHSSSGLIQSATFPHERHSPAHVFTESSCERSSFKIVGRPTRVADARMQGWIHLLGSPRNLGGALVFHFKTGIPSAKTRKQPGHQPQNWRAPTQNWQDGGAGYGLPVVLRTGVSELKRRLTEGFAQVLGLRIVVRAVTSAQALSRNSWELCKARHRCA